MTSTKWEENKTKMMLLIALAVAAMVILGSLIATVKVVAYTIAVLIVVVGIGAAAYATVEGIYELTLGWLRRREGKYGDLI